jgi:hypothetical protein
MSAASAAFAAAESIEAGEWDRYIGTLQATLYRRALVLQDRSQKPPRPVTMQDHQHWVWMNGPGPGHWEIRGTGVVIG